MRLKSEPSAASRLTEGVVEDAVAQLNRENPGREIYRSDVARVLKKNPKILGEFLRAHGDLTARLNIQRDPSGPAPRKEAEIRRVVLDIGHRVALTISNLAPILGVSRRSLLKYFERNSDLKKELGIMDDFEYIYDRYLVASLRLRTSSPPLPVTHQNLADVLGETIDAVKKYMAELKRNDEVAYNRLHITLMKGKKPTNARLTPADIMPRHDSDET